VNGPGPREIDVWYQCLHEPPTQQRLHAWLALLSEEEKARYHRFHFEKDRIQFAAAHALVRLSLSRHCAIDPAEWRFGTNAWGKPSILNPEARGRIGFNLSHTRDLVACAIGSTEALGLDVEWLDRSNALGDIARHSFAPAEIAYFEGTHPDRQRDLFFRFWTLKEAYIKARGQGLSIPLASFSFHLEEDERPAIRFAPGHEGEPCEWSFFEYQPTPSHRLAVAVHCSEPGHWKPKVRAADQLMAGADNNRCW
jgi:4'-phosphopantetheinyl transferase